MQFLLRDCCQTAIKFAKRVKSTVLPSSRIGHTATGLLKITTTETKPNANPKTDPNPTKL